MSGCLFCGIAAGDVERSLVYEDDVAAVVMDLMPVNRGHALVLPKRHATDLGELDEEVGGHLFKVGMRTAATLRRSGFPCEGVNLWVADGEAAGQEVFHVHLHVLPRFRGDDFRVVKEGGWTEPQPRDVLDADARQLQEAWA